MLAPDVLAQASARLTPAARGVGSKVMDDEDLDLEAGDPERVTDALRAAWDDLDGDVLSLDDV
ncbi:MAG: hypothetical protein M9894_12465 [Planctomycetes bacterium]|nr:hypothetical protein [Planctomycetota bacterium]